MGDFFSLCVEHLPNCYSVRSYSFFSNLELPTRNWSFIEHLPRALPTDMIFSLLESILNSELRDYSAESKHTLEIIIRWLQVSGAVQVNATDKLSD